MSQELIDKEMTDIFNPKEQMLMEIQPFNEMGGQLGAAPLAINVLGLLCLITTERDFDLISDESDNFKLLQFPGSFRACLCQAAHSGYKAFAKADSTMEAIRLHTGRVPNLLKSVLKLLYHPQATRKDLETYLPINLNEIKEVADECIVEATSVKEEFSNVLNLLSELQAATLCKQGKVKQAKKITEERIKSDEKIKLKLDVEKQNVEDVIEELKQEYKHYKEKFDKSLDEIPGVWSLIACGLVDGVNNVLSGVTNVLSSMNNVLSGTHNFEEEMSGNNDQEISTEKLDWKLFSANPEILRSYLIDMAHLENAYQKLLSLFQTDRNGETILCEKNKETVIGYVKKELDYRIDRLGNKEIENPCNKKLVKIILTTLELTKELDGNQGNAKKLKSEIEKYDEELRDLTLFIKFRCNVPQFQKRGPQMTNIKGPTSISDKLMEGAYKKVEMTRIAMDEARKQENEANKRRMQTMNDLNECISQLNSLEYEKEQQESILAVISKGIVAFTDFQKQWSQLISFFSTIANFIKCSMSKELNMFVKDADGTYRNDNTTSEYGREIVYLTAYQAVKTASCVHHLSEAYCSISRKHLVPLNNKLYQLLSLSCKNDGEIKKHRIQFKGDCLAVVEEIKSIITRKHQEYEQTSNSRIKSLYEGLQTVAPITKEKQNEIASNTVKMYENIVQNSVISDDSLDSYC